MFKPDDLSYLCPANAEFGSKFGLKDGASGVARANLSDHILSDLWVAVASQPFVDVVPNIVLTGADEEMIWADAEFVVAVMADMQSVGDVAEG